MNTPLEKVICQLTILEYDNNKTTVAEVIKLAIAICESRLQEEADVITEAFNAAGGEAGGLKYFTDLYRAGNDAAKSLYGFKYTADYEGEYEGNSNKSNR